MILITGILICSSTDVSAQTVDESGITVNATGEIQVRADLIYFNVNINQFNVDARKAFEMHKQQEQYLTQLLIDEGVADTNITANPINISYTRRYSNTGESGYETRQQVMITLDDVTQFESMQINLIENGFSNFSGSFASTEMDKASDEALHLAVKEARKKAEILATAADKEIIDVIRIAYSPSRPYTARTESVQVAFDASGGSLLQFERMIPIRESISVQYRIE